MIIHIESPKESVNKLLKLVRVQVWWIQVQRTKSIDMLYSNYNYLASVIEKNAILNSNKRYK